MKRVHALTACVLIAAGCASIAQAFVHQPVPGLGVWRLPVTPLNLPQEGVVVRC